VAFKGKTLDGSFLRKGLLVVGWGLGVENSELKKINVLLTFFATD